MKKNIAYSLLHGQKTLATKRGKTIVSVDISQVVRDKFLEHFENESITLPEDINSFTFDDVQFNVLTDCPPLYFNVNYAE